MNGVLIMNVAEVMELEGYNHSTTNLQHHSRRVRILSELLTLQVSNSVGGGKIMLNFSFGKDRLSRPLKVTCLERMRLA